MPAKIRLRKPGKIVNKKNNFRIVVCDGRRGRDKAFIEEIGYYSPASKQNNFKIDKERLKYWLSKGAVATSTIRSLIKKHK